MPLLTYHETDQVAVALFPLGVQVYAEPEARLGIGHSESVLFRDSHVALVGHAEMTPSFPRLGAGVRFSPIAVWDATARVSTALYYGAFSSLFPLDDGGVVADAAYLGAAGKAGEREGGWALRYDLSTRLKGKVGPIVAVVEVEGRKHDLHSFPGDLVWTYEPTEMMVVRHDGWTIRRSAIVFWEVQHAATEQDPKLWVGALGNWNSSPAADDENRLLGPFVAWKPTAGDAMPTFFLGSQAWLESRFRPVLPPFTFLAANWAR